MRRSLRLQCSFEKVLVGLMWVRVPHWDGNFSSQTPHHEYSHCSGVLGESRVSICMDAAADSSKVTLAGYQVTAFIAAGKSE